jgi:hypothetical protein
LKRKYIFYSGYSVQFEQYNTLTEKVKNEENSCKNISAIEIDVRIVKNNELFDFPEIQLCTVGHFGDC